ncbi:hypothetical protein BDZ94DRAFT_1258282 [Collybia nuda]|uniref:Uncharacterized protein n=1 Tax=Collybia nuda TaxID=64659 RepID=A0A9P5Y5I7_9AGAR|nr:hypothetical protein BDZ94DRAFT_1258282 [Collybia nuda]
MGKMPGRWWTKWEDRSECFDENGTFIGDREQSATSRTFLAISHDWMDKEELDKLERIMR